MFTTYTFTQTLNTSTCRFVIVLHLLGRSQQCTCPVKAITSTQRLIALTEYFAKCTVIHLVVCEDVYDAHIIYTGEAAPALK